VRGRQIEKQQIEFGSEGIGPFLAQPQKEFMLVLRLRF
jgi:hypothetical protein